MQVDNHQNKDLVIRNAKNYCLGLLAKKDYSVSEIKQKLQAKGFDEQDCKIVIEELLGLKFLDDERLAQNLILAYQGVKGKNWLRQKMRQRGINQEVVEEVLLDFNQNQSVAKNNPSQKIKLKLEKKYTIQDWSQLDTNTKQKVVGFLARNGFEDVFNIINHWSGG